MQEDYARRLAQAHQALAADPVLGAVVTQVGPCRLEPAWERSPYESLVRAVAYQQLHGRAAAAILGRFLALFEGDFPTPEQVLALDQENMRAVGFSRAKTAAIRDIAARTAAGEVPSRREAEALEDEELIRRLIVLRGVGRWTAEMLLIFSLGRLDVFPCDDYAVRVGVCRAYGLDEQPPRRALAELAEPWRPYRSVASWYLWRLSQTTVPD